jgi:mRNA-degrading endonuclease RelE of RelBE toxin-antitoxin system
MTFEINIKSKSLKFISSLEKHEKERLREAIFTLKEDPVPIKSLDIAKLKVKRICIVYVKESSELFMKLYGSKSYPDSQS